MDDRLALSVTLADGQVRRWGYDEPDAEDLPGDLTFTTSVPGAGFKTLECSLLRGLRADFTDLQLLGKVRAYGPGNRTVWEGRFGQFPRTDQNVSPGAVGHSAHLRDFPGFTELYVDRDLAIWQAQTLARRIALNAGGISLGDFSWSQAVGGLSCALPNQALGAATIAEVMALLPAGVKASKLMYKGAATSQPAGWLARLFSGDSDDLSTPAPDTNTLTLDDTLRTITLGTARRYHSLSEYSNGNAVTPAAGANVRLSRVALYGNHGLTSRAITGEPDGYYGDDLIADVVSRCAPLLTVTRGEGGIEQNTSFVIPQAAYLEPSTAEDVIQDVNKYFLWEWGVYDDQRFFWRPPDPTRLTWTARSDQGARISWEGENADEQFNGVIVHYTDPEGRQRIAGPPAAYWPGGVAHADATNSALVDTTATNPVNAQGIPQRWGELSISFATTDAGALQLGTVWLAEHSLPQRRGTITFQGVAQHPTEGPVPAWRPRAGDGVKIGNLPGDEPRRIIDTTYRHGTRELQCTVGNTDFKLTAILERVGVQLVGVL